MSKKWKRLIWVLVTVFLILTVISAMVTRYPNEMARSPSNSVTLSSEKPILGRVDKALREMELANIAFNTPSSLNINDSSQVHLVLSLGSSIQKQRGQHKSNGKQRGQNYKQRGQQATGSASNGVSKQRGQQATGSGLEKKRFI